MVAWCALGFRGVVDLFLSNLQAYVTGYDDNLDMLVMKMITMTMMMTV
jgi:hypothetical protein